jgi:hypothetical protein
MRCFNIHTGLVRCLNSNNSSVQYWDSNTGVVQYWDSSGAVLGQQHGCGAVLGQQWCSIGTATLVWCSIGTATLVWCGLFRHVLLSPSPTAAMCIWAPAELGENTGMRDTPLPPPRSPPLLPPHPLSLHCVFRSISGIYRSFVEYLNVYLYYIKSFR